MKPRFFPLLLAGVLIVAVTPVRAAECGIDLFAEPTPPAVLAAKARFEEMARGFRADANIDSILEISLEGRTAEAVDKLIAEGREQYFSPSQPPQALGDGFAQTYVAQDGEWRKTVKATTHNAKGQAIVPYLQIFYEDRFGGVLRLKPNGNSDAPKFLTHLKRPHGTQYFKADPNGDLSYENEAFKVHAGQALPKAPTQVRLPDGVKFGSPEAEAYLAACWTFRTHVPLAE